MIKKALHILTAIATITLLTSCGDRNINELNPIPSMPVSYRLNIMQDAPILNVAGGFVDITEINDYNQYIGYGGLVIFHGFDEIFYAFDLCCPYECDPDILVESSMAGVAICNKCGSTFDIGFGTGYPSNGPTKHPLRKYRVSISGYNLFVH